MRRGLIIYNPAARKAPRLEQLQDAMGSISGWALSLEQTRARGDATRLARQAVVHGCDAAVACGGDGTVNEVANGLAGSQTALATVRAGTANVWAKEIHVPRKLQAALRLLSDGNVRAVDLGRAGERYFLCMAGAGFDAAIVREMEAGGVKRRLGAAAYIVAGFRRALRHRAAETQIVVDREPLRASVYWLTLANTRNYGGVLNLAHMARADDGRLELLVLSRGGVFRFAWLALSVLLKRHQRRRDVLYRSVQSLEIVTPGLPVQVDGEYLGETPMRFDVSPRALRVIVPRGLRSPLFS